MIQFKIRLLIVSLRSSPMSVNKHLITTARIISTDGQSIKFLYIVANKFQYISVQTHVRKIRNLVYKKKEDHLCI